jgi:hypothetical protein
MPGARSVLEDPVRDEERDSIAKGGSNVSPTVRWLVFASVLLVSASYAAKGLKRGWFPWDEGVLAQSAESVLRGELPHRDYFEIYTGGLSYLNAAAFRLFGTNLASMRYMLFLFFLLWVPAFYYAVLRFVSVAAAAAVTLLAVAWSIPNYSAAMPSWYNLFFATFGLAALLRYIEMPRSRWPFVAGLCGGISCLIKVSGLYFVAGALLFFLFREAAGCATKAVESRREVTVYRIFLTVAVLLYETLVLLVLLKVAALATLPYFWLPNLAIGTAILWFEFHRAEDKSRRFLSLFRELMPFTVGAAVPIAIFLMRYVSSGSLPEIFGGITGSIGEHLQYVNSAPSVMKFVIGTSIDLLLGIPIFLAGPRSAKAFGIMFFLGIPVALSLARWHPYVDRAVWGTIWSLLPLVVVAGTSMLFCGSREGLDAIERQKLFLVLSLSATTNLIQFPFTTASYYCYVAPFVFLSAAALFSYLQTPPKIVLAALLSFCIFYIVFVVTPGFVMNMGQQYRPDNQIARLEIPRAGGLRVDPSYARTYDDLGAIIGQHARGEYIYAAPNCPEVYFLNGFRDPTATLFRANRDSFQQNRAILAALHNHDVNLIVINRNPVFSGPVSTDLMSVLELEFPQRAAAGEFEVRWKP